MNPRVVLNPHTAQVLASVFTSNAPHWLVYTLIGIGAAAYLAVGVLRLITRRRHRRGAPPARPVAVTAAVTRPQVVRVPSTVVRSVRREITS